MKALLLAAGRGTRMGSLTDNQPKCFAKLAGKKLVEWQQLALKEAGIDDIGAIGGYCAHSLASEVRVAYRNERWNRTNSVGSLLAASSLLEKHACVISYSDIVYHPEHVRCLCRGKGNIRITYDTSWFDLWSLRNADPFLDAESFRESEGWLSEIGGKVNSGDKIDGQFMGLIYMNPEGWSRVLEFIDTLSAEDLDRLDVTSLLSSLLDQGTGIGANPVSGRWCEVDTKSDKELYELELQRAGEWSHDWRWESIGKEYEFK